MLWPPAATNVSPASPAPGDADRSAPPERRASGNGLVGPLRLQQLEERFGGQSRQRRGRASGAPGVAGRDLAGRRLELVARPAEEAPQRREAVVHDPAGTRDVAVGVAEEVARS